MWKTSSESFGRAGVVLRRTVVGCDFHFDNQCGKTSSESFGRVGVVLRRTVVGCDCHFDNQRGKTSSESFGRVGVVLRRTVVGCNCHFRINVRSVIHFVFMVLVQGDHNQQQSFSGLYQSRQSTKHTQYKLPWISHI